METIKLLMTSFLTQANYFIAHPTSVTLVLDSDENIAFSALVIGAPTLGAILISMLHCHIISGYPTRMESNSEKISMFRLLLILSCLSAIIGNIVQVYGIENTSIKLTVSEILIITCSHCFIRLRTKKIVSIPPFSYNRFWEDSCWDFPRSRLSIVNLWCRSFPHA